MIIGTAFTLFVVPSIYTAIAIDSRSAKGASGRGLSKELSSENQGSVLQAAS
jgi:hypothetical protein